MVLIYLIGSLRNERPPQVARALREHGHIVFDSWYAAGPEADDYWQQYETARGLTYREALVDYAAQHVYQFDKFHLDRAQAGVLVLPAGKSGHLELGYLIGQGKLGYILLDQPPERWDVMYAFASAVCSTVPELLAKLTQDGG